MKIHFKYFLLFVISATSGCVGLQDFGKAHPEAALSWNKLGVSQDETRAILWTQCGYKKVGLTEVLRIETDRCMLSKEFKYTDIRYGGEGICDFPQYQQRPSCQSLKKQNK